jgi:hypothetical protein
VSATKTATVTTIGSHGSQAGSAKPIRAQLEAEAVDRNQLLDRLHQLRTIIPVFAQELAGVRRVADQLRTDNRRLLAEVQRLQGTREEPRQQG